MFIVRVGQEQRKSIFSFREKVSSEKKSQQRKIASGGYRYHNLSNDYHILHIPKSQER